MYLSIILIPVNSNDEEVIHATLLSCFGTTREEGEILYKKEKRISDDGSNLITYLKVQSSERPHDSKDATVLQSVEINPIFEKGQIYKVQTTLRPTKKIEGKLATIRRDKDRVKWVETQFIKHGAESLLVTEHNRYKIAFKGSAEVLAYNYEAVIKVKDPDLFMDAYVHGIRQSKAYGCGMLQLQIA